MTKRSHGERRHRRRADQILGAFATASRASRYTATFHAHYQMLEGSAPKLIRSATQVNTLRLTR